MQKRYAFMRSFDSAIEHLLNAAAHLDEFSAKRGLWRLTELLRCFEHEQLHRWDRERDFSRVRNVSESKRMRRKRRKHALKGVSPSQS